jgi:hypothetical protein
MVRIAMTAAAYDAIASTLPRGRRASLARRPQCLIRVEASTVCGLASLQW